MNEAIMDKEAIIADLKERYPGKKIFVLPEDNPTEIICETYRDDKKSIAIAIIFKSDLHMHKKTTEWYVVKKGNLMLYVDGARYLLNEGEGHTVNPEEEHFAEGQLQTATEVEVTCMPPWTPEDHILVE